MPLSPARDDQLHVHGHVDADIESSRGVVLVVDHGVPVFVFHRQLVVDRRDFARLPVSVAPSAQQAMST
jgi:hypothetical protein